MNPILSDAMKRNLENAATIGFCGVILTMIVLNILAYYSARAFYLATQQVRISSETVMQLESILLNLTSAESEQRGYLLTKNPEHLASYHEAVSRLDSEIEVLRQLTSDDPVQQDRIEELEGTIERKVANLEQTIRKVESFPDAVPVEGEELDEAGQQEMDKARLLVAQMRQDEVRLLEVRQQTSDESYGLTVIGRILRTGFIFCTLGVLFYLVRRGIVERVRNAAEIAEERERFRVTLASIGDGVITTDAQGRITFMNSAAEAMTGWGSADALGSPIAEVFRVVDSVTAAQMSCPVEEVLTRQMRAALRSNGLLISKNRVAYAVDDSVSPIRNADGQIIGTVIVFFKRAAEAPTATAVS